jgi:hypothetical protein
MELTNNCTKRDKENRRTEREEIEIYIEKET